MYLCLNNEFGIRYDRFIRALMNHGGTMDSSPAIHRLR